MSCGESLYNYINRQIKKISEKQHNFIRLQDRVNANIFNKLDEINNKLLDIEQGNNDEIKKEIEKLATQINEVKSIISQNATENITKFNDINTSILALQNKDKSQDTEIASIKEKNRTQDTEIASIKEKNRTQETEIASIKQENSTQDTEIASIKEKNSAQDTEIASIKQENSTQDTEIASIKEKNSAQDTEIASIKEKNSAQDERINTLDTRLQSNATEITKLKTKTDNTNTELETYKTKTDNTNASLETYKTNTSNEIDNINNTLNSVISYELTVNTGTEVNVKQDIFQNKVCSISGFFKTSHSQTGWSALIQLNNPYPKHHIQFVSFDSTGKKSIQSYIDNKGVIHFVIEYSGVKTIYFNVSYIA